MGPNTCLHHAGNNGGTGSRTNARWRVKPIKADTLFCQLINIRRLNQGLPVATEPTAHIL